MPSQHAQLSPSSSSRWLSCTASVEVSEQYENTTNSSAEWGTNVHYMGELILKGETLSVGDKLQEEGNKPFTVDQEMLTCAEEYVDYCTALIKPDSIQLVEERFDLTFIDPDTFGTGDFTTFSDGHLDVVDLKTGHNIVRAKDNTQLMLYGLGALHLIEEEHFEEVETITLHIVQTRAGHVDSWEVSREELIEFEEFAREQARNIREGDVQFNPNAKACKWCPHQTNCEALKAHVEEVVTGQFEDLDAIEGQADKIDNDHIKKILDNADLIEGFIKAVKEVALEKMQSGETIEGYKIVESKTNRKWKDEEEVAKYLNRKIPSKDLWVKKMIPMTQILKLRPKDKGLQELIIKPEGKPTLAHESDKRPAMTAVADDFEEL